MDNDDELPAGELVQGGGVTCAVCGRRALARPFDPTTLGARVLPAFEALPKGWTLLLGDPPRLLCSARCRECFVAAADGS